MTTDWKNKARDNASTIEGEIEKLTYGHWDNFKRDYKGFWLHAKQISHLFKTLKPIAKDGRQELWNQFSKICDETKKKQQSEHEDRVYKSKQHKADIFHEISRAEVNTFFGFDFPDLEEMKRLSHLLNQASRMLSENKQDMFGEHKQECFQRIQEVRRAHDAWWVELKNHKRQKHEEFQTRVRSNIAKNQDRLRKAGNALESCRRNADDLRDKIASAYNDNWAAEAMGWLAELEEKIRDIEDSIAQLEEWIEEDENKLR